MEGGERREEAPVAAVPGSLCPLRVVSRTAPTDLAAGNVASMASVASMRRMVRMSIVPRFGTHHHVCHHPVLCLLRRLRRLARWIALLQQALQVFPLWVAGFQNRGQLFQDLTVLKGKVRGWKRRDTAGGIVGSVPLRTPRPCSAGCHRSKSRCQDRGPGFALLPSEYPYGVHGPTSRENLVLLAPLRSPCGVPNTCGKWVQTFQKEGVHGEKHTRAPAGICCACTGLTVRR